MEKIKSFSSYLTLVICILVIVSTLLISTIFYSSLSKKMDEEFKKKAGIQASQICQLIEHRLFEMKEKLIHLSFDNTIRVTIMLGAWEQLRERLLKLYPSQNGVTFLVKVKENNEFYPKIPKDLPKTIVKSLDDNVKESSLKVTSSGVYWIFSMPIKRRLEELGKGFCILQLSKEKKLWNDIEPIADGMILIKTSKGWFNPQNSLYTGGISPDKGLLIEMGGLPNFYYFLSFESLKREKRSILWIIILALSFVLIVSLGTGVFLSNRMSQNLRTLAEEAAKISSGRRDIMFDEEAQKYKEFKQLARTFNHMLKGVKEAEELRRYQELFQGVGDAVYITDMDGNILDANDEAVNLFGFSREELLKLNINDLLRFRDDFWNKLVKKGRIKIEGEHKTNDGEFIPVEIHARITKYRGRQGVVGVLRDITERKVGEEELRRSEEKFRTIAENAPFGIAIIGSNGEYKYTNSKFAEIFNYSMKEIPQGDSWFELLKSESNHKEIKVKCKDGKVKDIYFRAVSLSNGDQLITVEDVTEMKELEAQLLQAQKMEAIGTLAGGIAHDFNNILATIQGYVELSLMSISEDNPIYRNLKQIHRAAVKAASLVQQLLLFSRKQPLIITTLNPNKVIEGLIKMLRRLIGENIEVKTDLEEGIWLIRGDEGNIEQVIMNLVINARDAMPHGGTLVIKTENVVVGKKYPHPESYPGKFVCITVQDTGVGMDKEVIKRIFEPFFTTKERGTGLGLSVVYGIVKKHNGWIDVQSEPGKGSIFRVYLPAIKAEEIAKEEEENLRGFCGSGEKILVVEDEKDVRSFVCEVLEKNGYKVIGAGDGKEALELFKNNRDIDLVFTDVVLPDKSGVELVGEILKEKPDTKVLMSSGYTDEKTEWSYIKEKGYKYLQKPFSISDLLKAIKEILEK